METMAVISYETTPEAADENQRLIEQVFAQLEEQRPADVEYTVLRLGDGVGFLHLVRTPDGQAPLTELPAFGEFQRAIGARVTSPPSRTEARLVGSYASAD